MQSIVNTIHELYLQAARKMTQSHLMGLHEKGFTMKLKSQNIGTKKQINPK